MRSCQMTTFWTVMRCPTIRGLPPAMLAMPSICWPRTDFTVDCSCSMWTSVRKNFLAQLLTRIPQNSSSDNHQINLLGALKDVIDLGVAHPFFQKILAR